MDKKKMLFCVKVDFSHGIDRFLKISIWTYCEKSGYAALTPQNGHFSCVLFDSCQNDTICLDALLGE